MRLRARDLLVLVPLVGCFAEEAPPIPFPGANAAPTTVPAQPATKPPTRPKRPRDVPGVSPAAGNPTALPSSTAIPQADQGAQANAEPPPRDLSDELRRMVTNPSACFSKRVAGSGPPSLTLSISATVTPSGMVNRASVGGAALSPDERACLEAIVVRARFDSPVEGAPTTVQTTVELREQAPAKKAP